MHFINSFETLESFAQGLPYQHLCLDNITSSPMFTVLIINCNCNYSINCSSLQVYLNLILILHSLFTQVYIMKVSNILLLAVVVINFSASTHAALRNAELQNIIEEEDKPSVVPPKTSVVNQVTVDVDESDRMLGGKNKKNKIKKFLKKKFKKNGGGVLPWKKDAVSNRSVHMICVCI